MPDTNSFEPGSTEARAHQVGWAPLDSFKGDPDKWVDAETYLKRADEILPIAQANNRRLQDSVARQTAEINELKGKLASYDEAIKDIQELHNAETKKAVERTRVTLVNELKSAIEANDPDAQAVIIERLTKGDVTATEAKKLTTKAPAPPPQSPEFLAWVDDNPWFNTDKRRQAVAVAISVELRNDPANAALTGRPFFDKVGQMVDEYLSARQVSKTEAGGRGAGGAGSSSKGYASLDAEARKVCDDQEKKMVGDKKPFKTQAAWREYYAKSVNELG